jgi:hypothetical protein
MLVMFASAALVCAGALVLGQAILRLCGAREWTWLAAPIGLAALLLVAVPSLHMPGRATAVAVVLFAFVLFAGVWVLRDPAHRPPLAGLLAAVPVALLCAVPFLSAGRAGTLGWSFNNDMASHLLWADAYRSDLIEAVNPLMPDYPLGPHALAAVVAQGLGVGVERAFAGVTIAATIVLGWTALAALRRPRPWGSFFVVPLVGMPFLIAAYFAQGAFKELQLAALVLAFAILLAFPPALDRRWRWVPAAVLLGAMLSVYSLPGLTWPLVFLGVWLAGTAVDRLRAGSSPRDLLRAARTGLVPAAIALAVLLVVIAPQIPRLVAFAENQIGLDGVIIDKESIGILVRPLPIWEAFGMWGNPDFRLPALDHTTNRLWIVFALGLVAFGAIWALRRREWMLVAATGAAVLVWAWSYRSQSPYVAAKALVILTPLLLLVAARALAERGEDGDGRTSPRWWPFAAPLLAALLLIRVADTSWGALRQAPVGPEDHMRQLRALQPTLDRKPTLFLGNDDFIRWELGETPVSAPAIGFQALPIRPEKPWTYGMGYDIDSLEAKTINEFEWVISPRDASASEPPAQLRPVRRTRDFVLYRRTGAVPPNRVLDEGDAAVARLRCDTPAGRAVVRAGGLATVRGASVTVPAPIIGPDVPATVRLPLARGAWDLVSTYGTPQPVEVTVPGLRATLPANLDRPGPRWPIGRIAVRGAGEVPVTLRLDTERWTPGSALAVIGTVTAVPVGSERTVPVAEACGKLVDHVVGERR